MRAAEFFLQTLNGVWIAASGMAGVTEAKDGFRPVLARDCPVRFQFPPAADGAALAARIEQAQRQIAEGGFLALPVTAQVVVGQETIEYRSYPRTQPVARTLRLPLSALKGVEARGAGSQIFLDWPADEIEKLGGEYGRLSCPLPPDELFALIDRHLAERAATRAFDRAAASRAKLKPAAPG